MPPKRGKKRKAGNSNGDVSNGHEELAPPDRETWPGWVEIESEPAFFNVMLKDMGVKGVKVQEVYSLDDELLAILPQPVHALIFLFRYRDVDEEIAEKGTDCPSHVWFANQIPDFACASVALLNIVNNIKGLRLGRELRDFKDFTQDMDPMSRGDAIDSFEFVRRIHNSFARENDLLIADMHCRAKANKAKKKQAAAKARETKEAKKEGSKLLFNETATNGSATAVSTPNPDSINTPTNVHKSGVSLPGSSSPLSDPPDSDPEFQTPSKKRAKPTPPVEDNTRRRSARQPKPRTDPYATSTPAKEAQAAADEEGFHFIAYMPITGHVWRMDGLDSFPQDMGAFESGQWMSIAQPALQTRMALYEGADIEFNLMAVVHDPVVKDWEALVENVRTLREVDGKLDASFEDWRALDGAETGKDVVVGCSTVFGIAEADVEAAEVPEGIGEEIRKDDDLLRLVELRKKVIADQAQLRGAVRDAREGAKGDEEKARHRRHDYGKFIRSWLGALAENELLVKLMEDAT